MNLKESSSTEIMSKLLEEFSSQTLNTVQHKLPALIQTSETLEQLIAHVYEAVNVEIEESQVSINRKLDRLDTRKNIL
jgi:hypothetical protein